LPGDAATTATALSRGSASLFASVRSRFSASALAAASAAGERCSLNDVVPVNCLTAWTRSTPSRNITRSMAPLPPQLHIRQLNNCLLGLIEKRSSPQPQTWQASTYSFFCL
jgi:hypothetical protein